MCSRQQEGNSAAVFFGGQEIGKTPHKAYAVREESEWIHNMQCVCVCVRSESSGRQQSNRQTSLQMFHCIVIVGEFNERLTNEKVPLNQLRIHFQSSTAVLTGQVPLTKFEVTEGTIREEGCDIRIAQLFCFSYRKCVMIMSVSTHLTNDMVTNVLLTMARL